MDASHWYLLWWWGIAGWVLLGWGHWSTNFSQLGEEFCQCHIALDVQIQYVIFSSIWLLLVEDGMISLCPGSLEEELNQLGNPASGCCN